VHAYRVKLASTAQLASTPVPVAFALAGTLAVHSQRSSAGTAFLVTIGDVEVRAAGDAQANLPPGLQEDLVGPWGFELVDGSAHAVRARGGTSPFAIAIIDSLAAAFQTPDTAPDGGSWEHAESDATGSYRARYEPGVVPGSFTRTKVAYDTPGPLHSLSLGSGPLGRLDATPKVIASSGEIKVRGTDLVYVQSHEEIDVGFTAISRVRSSTDLTLESLESAPDDGALDWATFVASTIAMPMGPSMLPRPAVGPFDVARANSVSFAQALDDLEKENEPAPGSNVSPLASSAPDEDTARARLGAFGTMVAVLRAKPESVRLATAAVERGSRARASLLDALGAAGTKDAQEALQRVARQSKLPDVVRKKAAYALIRTPRPTGESVDALITLLADKLLRVYAVYGLGTYARRLRESGESAVAERATNQLLALLGTTEASSQRVDVLRGISNSGDPSAFAAVRSLLADPDPSIRAAAVDALRLMPNAEVDSLVAARMSAEEKSDVRIEALDAAGARQPNEPLPSAVAAVATGAADPESRVRAVRVMGKWVAARPELRKVLEQVARDDSREAVRLAARAALGT